MSFIMLKNLGTTGTEQLGRNLFKYFILFLQTFSGLIRPRSQYQIGQRDLSAAANEGRTITGSETTGD